jgi:diacylglycerol kinase (ATP)
MPRTPRAVSEATSAGEPSVSSFKSKSGLARIGAAAGYSIAGFRTAWRTEHAFRQELVLFAVASVVAFVLPLPVTHRLLLVATLVLVLIVELLNSAIEAVVDRISLETHPLSKAAKDLGSAAVCLALVLAGLTWAVILYPLFLP